MYFYLFFPSWTSHHPISDYAFSQLICFWFCVLVSTDLACQSLVSPFVKYVVSIFWILVTEIVPTNMNQVFRIIRRNRTRNESGVWSISTDSMISDFVLLERCLWSRGDAGLYWYKVILPPYCFYTYLCQIFFHLIPWVPMDSKEPKKSFPLYLYKFHSWYWRNARIRKQ